MLSLYKRATTSFNNNKTLEKIDTIIININDKVAIARAFRQFFGKTIATSYLPAATELISIINAIKLACTAKSTGVKILAMIGASKNGII
jgi:hypothetical protein